MANSTNVPPPAFGDTGFIAPAESAILAGALQDLNAAFGGNLNEDLSTPQGQLASSLTAIVGNKNDQFVYYANQVDPAYASGRMQDGIARIYFIERDPAQPTVLQIQCIGAAGVTIPIGALLVDPSGNQMSCTQAVTIDATGSAVTSFAYVTTGPVAVPSSVSIYQTVLGWDDATIVSGVVGNDVETRSAFEERRRLSVAQNSAGSVPSVRGAVLSVPNVIDAFVTENPLKASQTIGGYTLAANSIYVAAVGGDPAAIAKAIWTKKAPGCGYNGNTHVVVQDTNAAYSAPYPSYDIYFETPNPLQILFSVTIANTALVPANAASLIQNAILSAFAGGDGGPRARIGSTIFASRFYAPIAMLGSWAQIVSLFIGSANTPASTFVGSVAGTTLTVTSMGSGSGVIAVGQSLTDAAGAILTGTRIVGFGTGSGGVGTYTINETQTVASETIFGVAANAFDTTVNINQVPVAAALSISVTLV